MLETVSRVLNIISIGGESMAVLKEANIPIGRSVFIPKKDGLTLADIEVEANGQYQIIERPECFVIKNAECCRSILATVKTKE